MQATFRYDSQQEALGTIRIKSPLQRLCEFFYKKNGGKNFSSTILPDLYVKRGDAYLCNYEFRNAIREYHRALDGFPDDSHVIGRWRLISTSTTSQHFLDMKNVELRRGQAQFWCKEAFAGTQPN